MYFCQVSYMAHLNPKHKGKFYRLKKIARGGHSLQYLIALHDIPGHFTKGKTYTAAFINDPIEENGWVIPADDCGARHWLNRPDGRNHSDITKEKIYH